MLTSREIKKCPRDDHPRRENTLTQPLKNQPVFNNMTKITNSWYPICPAKTLKKAQAKSFTVLHQRIVVFRTKEGKLRALDSFCSHLGADLGNGEVIGENLRCFYHHWSFDHEGYARPPCSKTSDPLAKAKINSYPVREQYGFIWVFSNSEAHHDIPLPPGLEGGAAAFHLKKVTLFAHHHVMMTNAIDLQHFKSVHNLAIDFNYKIIESDPGVFSWQLEGAIPRTSLKLKFAHYLLGGLFRYEVIFSGGAITSITYGVNQRYKGTGIKIPPIHILWGGTPLKEGVSAVDIFLIVKDYKGITGVVKKLGMLALSFILLAFLNDDDIKAFPHMRYNTTNLTSEDASLAKFIQLTNKITLSPWTNHE